MIFLPPLVFESAFGINWHIFKREFGKMLLLAGPGVVIVAIFEAIAFYWILDYKVDIFNKNIVLSMTDLHSVIHFYLAPF